MIQAKVVLQLLRDLLAKGSGPQHQNPLQLTAAQPDFSQGPASQVPAQNNERHVENGKQA